MAAFNDLTKVNNGRSVPNLVDRRTNGAASTTALPRSLPPAPNGRSSAPWRFVLIVDRAPDKARVRALGLGVTLLEEPYEPTVKLRFDWPASTRLEAIAAAVRLVESAGLRVLRVDNDDWVTVADIAHRVGRSRETVRLWAAGMHGPGGFPPPANPRRDTTFYSWAEVLPWLREHKRLDLLEEEPALVAANLAVRLRALLPRLTSPQVIIDLFR